MNYKMQNFYVARSSVWQIDTNKTDMTYYIMYVKNR